MILNYFLSAGAVLLLLFSGDNVYFRSVALHAVHLTPVTGKFHILDDADEKVQIVAMTDGEGVLYWHRRINTPVCLTGECRLVDVGLYWDCTGDFFGLEVYGEHLTKTDHSIFSEDDYARLMDILGNDWSILREYDFSELIDEKAEPNNAGPDATSGATRKEIASEAVSDAVYTTYTLWHLVHNGEKEQLEQLTINLLNTGSELTSKLINHENKRFRYFLLELTALGKLNVSSSINALIVDGLRSPDPVQKDLAVRALPKTDINSPKFQSNMAEIYSSLSAQEKSQVLSAIKSINTLTGDFYRVLEDDLSLKNEWLSVKVLTILKKRDKHSDYVLEVARRLTESENGFIRDSAVDFLKNAQ